MVAVIVPEDPEMPGYDVLVGEIGARTHYIHNAMASAKEPLSPTEIGRRAESLARAGDYDVNSNTFSGTTTSSHLKSVRDKPGRGFAEQVADGRWQLTQRVRRRIAAHSLINSGAPHDPKVDVRLTDRVRRHAAALKSQSPMDEEQLVIYFNNCHNRDHVALFGNGAFFDLGTTGRQGTQARDLQPGQPCVVAEKLPDKQIVFDWYLFSYEALLRDEHSAPDRVFFGRLFATETMSKEAAAKSGRYAPLFRSTGDIKIGSVFRKAIPSEFVPAGSVGGGEKNKSGAPTAQVGAGFGDPAENKLVEMAAVRAVVRRYEGDGWLVRSVERDKCGFDLECKKAGAVEHVEVKGVRGSDLCFVITIGEVKQARENQKFFLMVVTSALSPSPTLTKFSGAEFVKRFDLSTLQYRATLKR